MSTADRLSAALAERYRIERELGAGGMATVYLAADLKHDRKVAIKVLKPELAAVLGAERFVQEIKTTAALSHPHILPLFDSGEAGGFLYYVMPFIEGETIRDRLNRETQLGIDEAVKITTEVADALDYAHRHGVIHRDIKPENILLHDGRPMVMDFGIALAVSAAAGGRMTETGLSLGTPHYMSPEQATAEKEITGRSDIYSLASVLYEMLAGVPPHEGGSAQQTIMRIITDVPRPVTELRKSVPPNVAAALGRALEKLPADRFDSAKAFAEALANPQFTVSGTTAAVGAAARTRSQGAMLGLAALAAVAVIVAAWGWLRPPPPQPVARYRLSIAPNEAEGLAFTPDGSRLYFLGSGGEAGTTQLWVKERYQADPVPVPGTVGATAVNVSPDGQWVGFAAHGQLKRTPTGAGAATVLADSASGGPFVWLDDATVVFAGPSGDLHRVEIGVGASEVVFKRAAMGFPWPVAAVPGRSMVLLVVCARNCDPASLWLLDLRSGVTRQLLPDVIWATYTDGRLIFLRRNDAALYVVPFDPEAGTMRGDPVQLVQGVASFAVSASGAMAYTTGAAFTAESIEAVWVSRDGATAPVDTAWTMSALETNGWALSPDGTRLAITVTSLGKQPDIWIKDLVHGGLTRLTSNDSADIRPQWTPDGRHVTYVSNQRGEFDLYAHRADGTGQDSLIVDLEPWISESVWSRDSEWLVLRIGTLSDLRDIVAIRPGKDSVPRALLTGERHDEIMPALSPDGRWLAYTSNETGRYEVYVRPFPDVDAGKWPVSTSGGTSPKWAHSGKELFFVNGAEDVVSQAVVPGATFERGEQRVLFSIDSLYRYDVNTTYFDVSPDDRRFLMLRAKATGATNAASTLVIVENWMEEVNRLVRKR